MQNTAEIVKKLEAFVTKANADLVAARASIADAFERDMVVSEWALDALAKAQVDVNVAFQVDRTLNHIPSEGSQVPFDVSYEAKVDWIARTFLERVFDYDAANHSSGAMHNIVSEHKFNAHSKIAKIAAGKEIW